jgi:hypothetical protein
VEEHWRALLGDRDVAARWIDAPLRRFVHFTAAPKSVVERNGAHPASEAAAAYFAREAERLECIEDAARERGADPGAMIRWRTSAERPHGATSTPLVDEIELERVAPHVITLVAIGVPCACDAASWRDWPASAKHSLYGGRWDALSIETCLRCGACWLNAMFEDHYSNGSVYRGRIAAGVATAITAESAEHVLAALPWYWVGGSYHFGETSRSSGVIRWR